MRVSVVVGTSSSDAPHRCRDALENMLIKVGITRIFGVVPRMVTRRWRTCWKKAGPSGGLVELLLYLFSGCWLQRRTERRGRAAPNLSERGVT